MCGLLPRRGCDRHGRGTGIAAAIARRLAADGHAVAVMERRSEPLQEVVSGLAEGRAVIGEAYREAWPPFFEWQKRGAVFEIVSLDVTPGDDVAFATALLRCGTEEEPRKDPDNRLRLTVGLRKEGGRWVVSQRVSLLPYSGLKSELPSG